MSALPLNSPAPSAPAGVLNLFTVAFFFPVAVVAAVAVFLNWGR